MTDFMQIITERRSVRKYEEKEIPNEILNELLKAVQWAPSWANTQCWEIIVIKDKDIRHKMQDTITPKNPCSKAIVAAPVLIAFCGKLKQAGYYKENATTKFGDWFMYDLGLATQNLCLAAQSFGLGTVIAGSFDHAKAKEILKLPEGYEVVTLVPIGYPDGNTKPPKRRDIDNFIHHDVF
ncbi:MAG: nitroreductase [Desulfobacterales bacterium]|jgi:nitroreductase|nr:nitroreductase [Desulfobacteraceae bacterium]MBT4364696.1 nitroreductase [Desulfobacteraceae bacterium]MBT7086280.1 nitroreductase [Desulfobacterales bacterium]MBT7697418.1 nitroreductase [Desulfobacterales bacterium]